MVTRGVAAMASARVSVAAPAGPASGAEAEPCGCAPAFEAVSVLCACGAPMGVFGAKK